LFGHKRACAGSWDELPKRKPTNNPFLFSFDDFLFAEFVDFIPAAIAIVTGAVLIIYVRLKFDISEVDIFTAALGADSRLVFHFVFP